MSKNGLGRPLKFKTPEEMQKVIDEYFEKDAFVQVGDTKMFSPTVSGLSFKLGMSTEAFRNYGEKDDFLVTVKMAKQRIEIALEQRLYGSNVTGTIFNLKNNFGWKDTVQQELSGPDGAPIQTTELTPEQARKRADELDGLLNDD